MSYNWVLLGCCCLIIIYSICRIIYALCTIVICDRVTGLRSLRSGSSCSSAVRFTGRVSPSTKRFMRFRYATRKHHPGQPFCNNWRTSVHRVLVVGNKKFCSNYNANWHTMIYPRKCTYIYIYIYIYIYRSVIALDRHPTSNPNNVIKIITLNTNSNHKPSP